MEFFYKNYFIGMLLFLSMPCFTLMARATETNQPSRLIEYGSPERYYNEALNAEKNGNNCEASLALRRALVLNPTLTPAREHLAALLEKMGLPVDSSWKERTAARVSPEMMMLLGMIIGWSAPLLSVWIFFMRHAWTSKRKIFFCLGIIFFFIGHGMTLLGFMIDPRVTARHQIVLFPRQGALENETKDTVIPLRATPVDNEEVLSQLPAGSVLKLLSEHGVWSYVRTSSGQQGWISSSLMESLIPRN